MNRRESLKLRSASKNMYPENCFIDRRPIRFDALVHCTDLTQFRERQRVYFRCKLPTTVFFFYSAQPPAIVKGILVALVYFISKRWMARISLQQVPWFHINFLHAHRNFTFMLCLFHWFCWINTLWKQDVLVWHNTRSRVTFDYNQYCHLYSKRLWVWDIALKMQVQHA